MPLLSAGAPVQLQPLLQFTRQELINAHRLLYQAFPGAQPHTLLQWAMHPHIQV